MANKFIPNRNMERELESELPYRKSLAVTAGEALTAAKAIAPAETGKYRDSLEVEVDADGARLVTHDPFGHLVEWGSKNNAAYAPLRRGVRTAGLKLREE